MTSTRRKQQPLLLLNTKDLLLCVLEGQVPTSSENQIFEIGKALHLEEELT